jgi:monovalent cation/hydrogen antiporter
VLAINVGLAALRFAWVLGTLKVNALRARLRGLTPSAPPSARVIAAASVAGARGAITLAGVLTLPLTLADQVPFPARDLTIFLAAGVIIVSLLTANVFLPRLLRGLEIPAESTEELGIDRARVAAAEAAISAIRSRIDAQAGSATDTDLYTEVAARIMEQYRRRIDGRMQTDGSAARIRRGDIIERDIRLAALRAERDTVFALTRAHRLSDDSARGLVREIDLMEERLQ